MSKEDILMARSWFIPVSLAIFAFVLWITTFFYQSSYINRTIITIIAILIIYIVFRSFLEDRIIKNLTSSDKRYYFSKMLYSIYLLINFIIIWIIWVEDIRTLLLGFGLVAAAFTISIQDVAKNLMGGLVIKFNNIYKVGDRIEVGGKKGDVIDINLLHTTIMEMSEWVSSDQHTGRLSSLPNFMVLSNAVNNYTKDFNFVWDEIILPISYDSDWKAAESLIIDIVIQETHMIKEHAEEEISSMERKYYISKSSTDPEIFFKLTDNWIELTARYVAPARQRRILRTKISRRILEAIEETEGIRIASESIEIARFPEIGFQR
jgi:small-conductance mechanosensitive channel